MHRDAEPTSTRTPGRTATTQRTAARTARRKRFRHLARATSTTASGDEPTPFPLETQLPYRIAIRRDSRQWTSRPGPAVLLLGLVPRAAQPLPGPGALLRPVRRADVPDRASRAGGDRAQGRQLRLAAPADRGEAARVRRRAGAGTGRQLPRHAPSPRRPDPPACRAPRRPRPTDDTRDRVPRRPRRLRRRVRPAAQGRRPARVPDADPAASSPATASPPSQRGRTGVDRRRPAHLCEAVGQPIPDGVQGRSLAAAARRRGSTRGGVRQHRTPSTGTAVVAYDVTDRPPLHFAYDGPTFDELNTVTQSGAARMLRMAGHWKLIVHADLPGELYDLDSRSRRAGQPLRRRRACGRPRRASCTSSPAGRHG